MARTSGGPWTTRALILLILPLRKLLPRLQRVQLRYASVYANLGPPHRASSQNPEDGGVYIITNDRYNTAMDLNARNNTVIGYKRHGKPNQHVRFLVYT